MYWQDNHINFDKLPDGIYINFDWKEDNKAAINFSKCRYLIIWHHSSKEKSYRDLPDIPDLEYLEINWSNAVSLEGLSKFGNLKRLELHYCIKLETLGGVETLNKEIEHIHINQSKKLTGHKKITQLQKLHILCFNDCGSIDDMYFIEQLSELRDFRFVNTNIINGDLSPLIRHPKIENAGFLNKRHYSHKDTEIDKLIAGR